MPTGKEYEAQGSGSFIEKLARFFGKGEVALQEGGVPLPTAAPEETPPSASVLAEVERVRQVFPETCSFLIRSLLLAA